MKTVEAVKKARKDARTKHLLIQVNHGFVFFVELEYHMTCYSYHIWCCHTIYGVVFCFDMCGRYTGGSWEVCRRCVEGLRHILSSYTHYNWLMVLEIQRSITVYPWLPLVAPSNH